MVWYSFGKIWIWRRGNTQIEVYCELRKLVLGVQFYVRQVEFFVGVFGIRISW